jgi:hypothetical protein
MFFSKMNMKGVRIIVKVNRCVVRNQAYPKCNFNSRERHSERMNENYGNGDILPEWSNLNVQFKSRAGQGTALR